MVSIRRILCPTDLSEFSARALHHALALARTHGAALTVLHVDHVLLAAARDTAGDNGGCGPATDAGLRRFLDARRDGSGEMRLVTTSGDPVRQILSRARDDAADLIVMATHGRSGLARTLLGSVTEAVVRQALCPVMTIPPAMGGPAAVDLPAFDPILCATAFSPSCRTALDTAISIAQEADARVILVHALSNARTDEAPTRGAVLSRLRRGLPSDAVFRCHPEVAVVDGPAGEALLRVAMAERVNLIVMGAQARGALDRLIFGSTTREVLRAATCPVLTVRADDTATPWDWPPHTRPDLAASLGVSS